MTLALGASVGAAVAGSCLYVALRFAPSSLVRTNVSGREVPAVLALPLLTGAVVGLVAVFVVDRVARGELTTQEVALALLFVVTLSALAGFADDRRGDEPSRGFAGHLGAAFNGRITGGLVKIVGVGIAGLGAGLLVGSGWYVVEVALLVGLAANTVNLLDRAPGRAGKVALLGGLALAAFGAAAWTTVVGGLVGALVVCLVPDLRERAMLGDAGANPLGAALGLGLAVSFERPWRLLALALLVLVNLASERWSFSRGIQRVAWLRALDDLGRVRRRGAAGASKRRD